jgi:SepF-like predicted cell division protein (DUF552 family)
MGLMRKIITGSAPRSADEYVELDLDDIDMAAPGAALNVRIASISEQKDVIDIKDAVYDGDMVIADVTRHNTSDRTMERIVDSLRQVAEEVNGDIVQKGDDQLIITPTGVGVSRQKLN